MTLENGNISDAGQGSDVSAEGLLSFASNTPGIGDAASSTQTPTGYWPEGAPEPLAKLRGVDDKSTIETLTAELGKFQAPEKSDAYVFEPADDFKKRFGDLKDDPALAVFRDVAHKAGLSPSQFNGAVQELYATLNEKGMMAHPIDANAELEKLEKSLNIQERDAVKKKALVRSKVQGMLDDVRGLAARGILSKEQAKQIADRNLTDADTFVAFGKIMELLPKEHGLQTGGKTAAKSLDDLREQMRDPRWNTLSPKYDPAFRTKVDAEYEEVSRRR